MGSPLGTIAVPLVFSLRCGCVGAHRLWALGSVLAFSVVFSRVWDPGFSSCCVILWLTVGWQHRTPLPYMSGHHSALPRLPSFRGHFPLNWNQYINRFILQLCGLSGFISMFAERPGQCISDTQWRLGQRTHFLRGTVSIFTLLSTYKVCFDWKSK